MSVISSPHLPPGTVLIVSPDVLNLLTKPVRFDAEDFGPPVPYDRHLVPAGHEPVFLLTEGDWLFWHDRVRLNNDLIRLFGTRRKLPNFKASFSFAIKPWNPRSVLPFGGIA